MTEWKVRAKLYAKLFPEPGDNLQNEVIIERHDKKHIIEDAINYPISQSKELYYPGKSYAVAITYAYLLSLVFKEDFWAVLDDPELLGGNDPYFKRYSEDKRTYDAIMAEFPFEVINFPHAASENFLKTMEYFDKEFLLAEDTKQYAPTK
jgi:hypothetical protein